MFSLPALKCLLFFDSFSLLSKGYSTLSYWKMRGITHDFHILARRDLLYVCMIPLALVDSIVTYSVIKKGLFHTMAKSQKTLGLIMGKKISKTILSQVAINPFLPTWHIFKKNPEYTSSKRLFLRKKNLNPKNSLYRTPDSFTKQYPFDLFVA